MKEATVGQQLECWHLRDFEGAGKGVLEGPQVWGQSGKSARQYSKDFGLVESL